MNINFNSIIKQLIPFLVLTLIAYLISSIAYIYLPKSSPILNDTYEYNIEYKKYSLYNNFKEKKEIVKEVKKEIKVIKEYELIANISLKAIYSSSISTNGWIIVAQNNTKQTHISSVGDMFKEYTLIKVFAKYVIFEKNNKEYKLSMSDTKTKSSYTTVQKPKAKPINNRNIEKIDDVYTIKRKELNLYKKDLSKIWKNVSIKEIKKDGKIDGFKINRISSKSIFEDLGLKKGDIIKGVNNVTLKSYADAFKIYGKIDKIDNIQFTILRDNEIMEMEYEIK